MSFFQPHRVEIKNTKANRKALKGWRIKGTSYPVLAMEVEDVPMMADTKKKPKDQPVQLGKFSFSEDADMDDDDQEFYADPNPAMAVEMGKRVWMMIASELTGDYIWVTTEDVKFVNASARQV